MKLINIEIESDKYSRIESGTVGTDNKIELEDIINFIESGNDSEKDLKIQELERIIDSDFIVKNHFVGTTYYKRDTKEFTEALIGDKNKEIKKLEKDIGDLRKNKNRIILIVLGISTGLLISLFIFI